MRKAVKRDWCDCPDGPTLYFPPGTESRVTARSVYRTVEATISIFFPDANDGSAVTDENLRLEHVSRINYTFWKPIEIPIDVTVKVPAR